MRFRHPRPFLCFCIFIQVTLAHPKHDYLKNGQRTNPKKYHPTSLSSNSMDDGTNNLKPSSRHSSKFPHFDQIKSRIAGLDSAVHSDSSAAAKNLFGGKSRHYSDTRYYKNDNNRWGSSDSVPRLRHHGWSNRARTTSTTSTTTPTPSPDDDDLFYNYGELDEEEEQMEDNDPEDIFDTSDDDDIDYSSFQAEEPTSTERPITAEPRRYSSLSEYKWEELGTMERVRQARKNYIQQKKQSTPEESKTTAVVEHYIRVKNTGQCKQPIPKVIPVHVEHPDPSVTYIPQCTVLHRCAADTGCCKYDTTCQYKERVEVSLYFYVKQIGAEVAKVEKLTFYNHTECECKDKPQEGSEDETNTTERQKRVADTKAQNQNVGISQIPENLLMKCKCPKEFTPKIKFGSKCHCDCDDSNEDCLRMKRGREYNSLADRLCIQKKQCGTVTCEYGPYNKHKGRCPKYDEA